ncbi:MAG TPA: DUF4382 domain-containing protein [Gammaproteobacteria bacterium]|jgi:hypothetical protein|nr:DUF4382 domain-containing protein [Gammaproteobacteria bacterium]
MLNRMLKTAALALPALFLMSCGYGNVNGVSLAITDAPLDLATSVNISFAKIEFSGPDVSPFKVNIKPASSVDVFQLQGGIAATVLSGLQVKPGHYTNLRVTLAADPNTAQSNITLPDGLHILYIPAGVSTKVDIPIDFTIASGGSVNLTMDVDLRKSIIQDPDDPTKYQLIPSIRAVETERSGTITGSVDSSLIACLSPAVYVYSGHVTPTDVDIADPTHQQPLSTALVGLNATTGNYNFTVGFLPTGDYTVAFTCQATLDVANQSNPIQFTSMTRTSVQPRVTSFIALQ